MNYFKNFMLSKSWFDFLYQRNEVSPILLLIQLMYIHLFGNIDDSQLYLFCCIGLSLLLKTNYYWFTGIMLSPGLGALQPLNLLFGALTCNELSTTLLFCYTIFNSLLLNSIEMHLVFNLLSLLSLAFFVWNTLPLQELSKNQNLFISLSVLWVVFATEYIQSMLLSSKEEMEYTIMCLLPITAFSAHAIFKSRTNQILGGSMEELTCEQQVIHYIHNKKKKMEEKLEKMGIKYHHESNCVEEACFCSDLALEEKFENEYILSLYKQGFMKFTKLHEQYALHQSFVIYLIEHDMFPMALEAHLRFKSRSNRFSLYQHCYNQRIKGFLDEYFEHLKERYVHKSVYNDFLQYQSDFQTLRGYLLDLTELKTKFWNQINCTYTKIMNIKQIGIQYLKNINKMHKFYLRQIKQIQKESKMFSGGIIYNLFLLTATNYKDVAQGNIKEMKKESDSLFSCELKSNHKLYTVKVSGMEDKLGLIENTSKSFKKIVDFEGSRAEIIHRPITEFIPPVYVAQHERGIKNMKKVTIGKFMGQNVGPLFLFTKAEKLCPCSMSLKYSVNIINELSIISVIKQVKHQAEYAIVDVQGNFKYSSRNSQKYREIVNLKAVKESISIFTEKWSRMFEAQYSYPVNEPVKLEVSYDQSTYSITIDSPLSESFRFPNSPPLHLTIIDEMAVNYQQSSFLDDGYMGCALKINKLIDQVETDSQTSSMTRRPEIINVLKRFEGASQLKIFNLLMILIGCCFLIGALFVCVQTYTLDFSGNTGVEGIQSSYFTLAETIYSLQNKIARVMNKGLSIYGITKGYIEASRYSETYGTEDYITNARSKIWSYCRDIREIVSNQMTMNTDKPKQAYYDALSQKLKVQTPRKVQYISYSGVLRKFILDCYQVASSKGIEEVISGAVYWQTLYPQTTLLIGVLQKLNSEELVRLRKLNILLVILSCAALMICILPIYFCSRNISKEEDSIYEMLVSLEPDLIQKQVQDLIQFAISLKSKTTTTFTPDHNIKNVLQSEVDDIRESNLSSFLNSTTKKKRKNGTLDWTGYSQKRLPLYIFLLVFIMVVSGISVSKYMTIGQMVVNLQKISERNTIINQRLILEMNLKKYVFQYQSVELIEGKNLQTWSKDSILSRKLHYDTDDDPTPATFKCQTDNILCNSTALNSELAMNMFFENLATQTYVTFSPHQLPFMELLEQVSFSIHQSAQPQQKEKQRAIFLVYDKICKFLFYISWALCLALGILTFAYLVGLKKQFVMLIWTVSFLNEEMILLNKRVHSFLQRMSKDQR